MSKSSTYLLRLTRHCLSRAQSRNVSSEIRSMSMKHLGKGTMCPPLTKGLMRLYSMKFCPFAQRTRLVLEYKGIPYETVNINLKSKPDWFRERYINGLVPVLEKDGLVVYESAACNEYLDDVYTQNKLIPSDPVLKAKDKMLSEQFGKVISLFYDIPKAMADNSFDKILRIFHYQMTFYDKELTKRGEFYGGSKPCNVDFMIWPWFERFEVINEAAPETAITVEKYPHLAPWIDRMNALPCVRSTYCKPEEHAHFFRTLREGNPDYDYGTANL